MKRFEVANVREAVELAAEYRHKGEYDWFRGQTVERSPYPSLLRLQLRNEPEAVARNKRRVLMFCRWLRETPQLAHLLKQEHVHDLFAILQHYGIGTYYLDFSLDPAVAGFFACDTPTPPSDGLSCIYCLNSRDLLELWETMSQLDARKDALIECVTLDVRNLWRLQAQAGVFLYVNYNWDVDYPMDRIVFPYTGYPPVPPRDRIYPRDRSALEQLLDQYFDLENATFANEKMREWLIKTQGNDSAWISMDNFERGIHAPSFIDAPSVSVMRCWEDEALKAWHVIPDERFHETVGRTLRLRLNDATSPTAISDAVRFGTVQTLRSEPKQRNYALQFLIDTASAALDTATLGALLERAWNGMRWLPFTDEEIGECLGRVALLHATGFASRQHSERRDWLTTQFGPVANVSFGPEDGSASAGWVSQEALMKCLRKDMGALLTGENKSRVQDLRELFKVIYNPRLMFEFVPFRHAFSRDVIPTQVVDTRKYIHFNPATLSTFGNQ